MAKDQLDLQFEIPVEIPNGGEPQINGQQIKEQQTKQEPPLTLLLHQAKLRMIKTTKEVMSEYGIPAIMMEGILSGVLSDIRAQASVDLVVDFQKQLISQKKEGEKRD